MDSTPRSTQARADAAGAAAQIEAARSRAAKQGAPDADDEKPGTYNTAKCLLVLGICNMLTPLDTQSPTPLIPLLIHQELGLPIATVGKVFAALTISAMLSFMMLMPCSKIMSPRKMLLMNFTFRLFSGFVYVYALSQIDPFTGKLIAERAVPLLYVNRAMYGITLNTFALPNIWVAVRTPNDENRPKLIAGVGATLMLGIILGPSLGATMASLAPTALQGYALPGYFTVVECLISIGLVLALFDDYEPLPTAPKAEASDADVDAAKQSKVVTLAITWNNFMLTLGFMAGFETVMGLAIYHSYDWDATKSLRAWGPLAVLSFVGFMVAPGISAKVNTAKAMLFCIVAFYVLYLCQLNFTDLTRPVSLVRYYLGMSGTLPMTLQGIILQVALASRVLKHEQVGANALTQVAGQCGRSIGPIISTWWYDLWIGWYGTLSGYNGIVIFLIACMALAHAPLLCIFSTVFGKLSDPSPEAARNAAKNEMH